MKRYTAHPSISFGSRLGFRGHWQRHIFLPLCHPLPVTTFFLQYAGHAQSQPTKEFSLSGHWRAHRLHPTSFVAFRITPWVSFWPAKVHVHWPLVHELPVPTLHSLVVPKHWYILRIKLASSFDRPILCPITEFGNSFETTGCCSPAAKAKLSICISDKGSYGVSPASCDPQGMSYILSLSA